MRGNNPALELKVVDASTNWETVMIGPSHFTDDIWDMRQFMPAKTTSECNKYLKFYYIKNPNMKHIAKQYAYYKLGRVKPKSVQLYINGFLRPFFEFCEMNGIHRLSEMTREQFFEYNRWLKEDKKIAIISGSHSVHAVEEIIRIGQIKGWDVPNTNILRGFSLTLLWDANPSKSRHKTKPIPPDVFDQILYHAVHNEKDILTKASIIIQSQTGLRIHEVLSIQQGCIKTTSDGYDYMEVRVGKTEKGEPVIHKVFINELVKMAVSELSDFTANLRCESGLKELFLIRRKKIHVSSMESWNSSTFFRAMGNPLEQDTQMDHFLLIPENTWHKLFWSLMGGTANCFLDLLPAVIVAALLLGENMLIALAWIPLIVSVDFFATTVGAFIGLSVPVSAGKMIKQLIQILFIYFGLLPDIAIMAIGLVFEQPVLAAIGCVVVNILLGLVFFFLTPLFLEPKDGKKYAPERTFTGNLNEAKKHFSRLGLGTFVILGLGAVVQILAMGVVDTVWPQWMENSWGMWLITFAPLYLIAVPVGLLLLRKVPVKPLEKHDLKPGRYIVSAIICIFMMYAGNILGTVIAALLQLLPGISAGNPVLGYATDDALLPKVLFMVILAPVIEEYIFRKQLIDRMHIYGEKVAVITSALMFGLFHGNLSQLFYAFALGLVFGYVYLKTGKLRYSIGLHMLINFIGSVVGPFFLEKLAVLDTMETMDMAALEPILPWLLGFGAYVLVLIGLAIAGLVLLCINKRRVSFAPAELELPKESRFRTVYLNVGMILLILGCAALIISNVIML